MSFAQIKKMMMSAGASAIMQIDGGTFTLDEALDSGTKTINHSLGSTPYLVVVFSVENAATSSTGVLAWALKLTGTGSNNYVRTGGNVNPRSRTNAVGVTAWGSSSFTITADSANSTAPLKIPADVPYYWIAVRKED